MLLQLTIPKYDKLYVRTCPDLWQEDWHEKKDWTEKSVEATFTFFLL